MAFQIRRAYQFLSPPKISSHSVHPVAQRGKRILAPFLCATGLPLLAGLLFLSGCSADLVVHDVDANNPKHFQGIRVYSPAMFKVTKEIASANSAACPKKTIQTLVQLPFGDPYDVTVRTATFAKSEFAIMFSDAGLLHQVTLNSTPQLADNIKALAELTKALGEATKSAAVMGMAANCGEVTETI